MDFPVGVDFFSPEVRGVMAAARGLATADGAVAVDTGHLLLALVETDEDVAAFLRTVNSSPAALRRSVAAVPTSEEVQRRRFRVGRRPPLTVDAVATLMYAAMLAGRARRARGEHLLASLCRGTASRAQDVLRDLGVRSSDVGVFFARRRDHAA